MASYFSDDCPLITILPQMSNPVVTDHPGDTISERFHFECSLGPSSNENIQFLVRFLFDGEKVLNDDEDLHPVDDVIVTGLQPVAVLHDYQLRGRLGKSVISSYYF